MYRVYLGHPQLLGSGFPWGNGTVCNQILGCKDLVEERKAQIRPFKWTASCGCVGASHLPGRLNRVGCGDIVALSPPLRGTVTSDCWHLAWPLSLNCTLGIILAPSGWGWSRTQGGEEREQFPESLEKPQPSGRRWDHKEDSPRRGDQGEGPGWPQVSEAGRCGRSLGPFSTEAGTPNDRGWGVPVALQRARKRIW